jgi:hypothetical protein
MAVIFIPGLFAVWSAGDALPEVLSAHVCA